MDQAEQLRNVIKMNRTIQLPQTSSRIISVTSGKGGVGKSNVSVNLAVNLQKMGKRVIIFDADFGLANVEVMFGAIPKYTLGDLIYKGKSIKDIISTGPNGVRFISGGSGIMGLSDMRKDQIDFLVRSMAELDNMADVIIIDTGAGISNSVMDFVTSSSDVVLVMTPEPSSLTDSYSLLKSLYCKEMYNKNDTIIKVISNKATSEEEGILMYNKLKSVVNKFLDVNMEFLGIIPADASITKAVMQQMPVSLYSPTSKSAKAFEKIAENLINNESYVASQSGSGMAKMFMRFLNKGRSTF